MNLEKIVERCSRFSGYNLVAEVKDPCPGSSTKTVEIFDPKDKGPSMLCLGVHSISGFLYEHYGRMRHWAITREEQNFLLGLLGGRREWEVLGFSSQDEMEKRFSKPEKRCQVMHCTSPQCCGWG